MRRVRHDEALRLCLLYVIYLVIDVHSYRVTVLNRAFGNDVAPVCEEIVKTFDELLPKGSWNLSRIFEVACRVSCILSRERRRRFLVCMCIIVYALVHDFVRDLCMRCLILIRSVHGKSHAKAL